MAAPAITGYTPEEFYADPHLATQLTHPDDRPLLEAVNRGDTLPGTPDTFLWVRKEGEIVWTEQRRMPTAPRRARGNIAKVGGAMRTVGD